MKYEDVRYDVEGEIAVMTIARPEVRNALRERTWRELTEAVEAFGADKSLRVAILTGAGDRAFCAGADMKAKLGAAARPLGERPVDLFDQALGRCRKPLIAAVNGYAVGGGFELALMCDLVVASEGASFGLPEVSRGLIPNAGGLIRLGRWLPRSLAMELALTGSFVSARRAYELGLVNRVVAVGDLMKEALGLAGLVAKHSPRALAAARTIVRRARDWPEETASQRIEDLEETKALRASDDARRGMEAFLQNREAQWNEL